MTHAFRTFGIVCGAIAAIGLASTAQAEYFVRPYLQYQGQQVDGLSLNASTNESQTFNDGSTALEAHVDLASGTIKTYLQMYGPNDVFGGATGTMGDQIRYTGSSDTLVSLHYNFDSQIYAEQTFTGTPPEFESRYIGIQAYFAIYEAGSGADYDHWTSFDPISSKALYVDSQFASFEDYGDNFYEYFQGSLGTDLFLTSGKSYDIFAAFNLIVVPGSMEGPITMNALNTSTISIDAPGGSFTSQSGAFLGFQQTAAAVPEPASWAMMIGGFGLVGGAMRRRARTISINCA